MMLDPFLDLNLVFDSTTVQKIMPHSFTVCILFDVYTFAYMPDHAIFREALTRRRHHLLQPRLQERIMAG